MSSKGEHKEFFPLLLMDLAFVDSTEQEQVFNNEIKTKLVTPSLHKSCAQSTKRNNQRRTEINVPPSMHACIHVYWSCSVKMEKNLALWLFISFFSTYLHLQDCCEDFKLSNLYIFIMQFVNRELNSYAFFLLFPMKEVGEFWPRTLVTYLHPILSYQLAVFYI